LSAYQQLNQTDKGVEYIQTQTSNPAALATLAHSYLQAGKTDLANDYLAKLQELAPDDRLTRETHLDIVEHNLDQQLQAHAIIEARQSALEGLAIAPNSPRLLADLTELELQAGNVAEARKIAEQIQASSPGLASRLLGEIALSQGDSQSALDELQTAWSLLPENATGARLHQLLKAQRDPLAADVFLSQWLGRFPDSPSALSQKALSLFAKNDVSAGVPYLERAVQQSPYSAALLNNLAWAYQETGDTRALATAEKAAKLNPESGDILDTLGWILLQNGSMEKAISVLEKAKQLAPDNEDIAAHLLQAKQQFGSQ
jgi:tetratricopeptide (TPR) repeat protein